MALCPVAIVADCAKCPAFKICPLKTSLWDQKAKPQEPPAKAGRPGQRK